MSIIDVFDFSDVSISSSLMPNKENQDRAAKDEVCKFCDNIMLCYVMTNITCYNIK